MNFKKTRLAPTPSGFLHIGNILSFLITTCLAKKHHAKILLRIDDLDETRTKDDYIQDIFETLDFMEIPYDEGPKTLSEFKNIYSQKHRAIQYKETLEWLKVNEKVFACDCSRKMLSQSHPNGWYTGTCIHKAIPLDKEGVNWRIKPRELRKSSLRSYPNQLITKNLPENMKNFVVRKKNQMPSYQLASLLDDLHFGVDLIIRGEDLWDSSLAQMQLASLLPTNPFRHTTFHHHHLFYENNIKISKSAGALSIKYMRDKGAKKEDIFMAIGNYLEFEESIINLDAFCLAYLSRISGFSPKGKHGHP